MILESTRKIGIYILTFIWIGQSFQMAGQSGDDKYFEMAKNLEIFTNIYKELNGRYVDELEPNQLIRHAIDGLMNSLDPYTVYYSEAQMESYRLSNDDKYIGVGAAFGMVDSVMTFTEIFKGGPAHDAGIRAGDQLLRINGRPTTGRSYDQLMQFLRGLPGTTLELTVHTTHTQQKNYSIKRAAVDAENVPYYGMLNDNVGYIHLTTFTRGAANNIANAFRELRENKDLKALILDLRGNGGGLLLEAIDIVSLFVPQGTSVVSRRGKVIEKDQNYSTKRLPIDTELPIAVLVNKSSASASEIVSGSIQDLDRGIVVGQRTYGKGLVQNFAEVGYNARMKLTTSKYYIPSGRCIQSVAYENGEPVDIPDDQREVFYTRNRRPVLDGGGVTPDIKIEIADNPVVLQALLDQHVIFKYANHYVSKHQQPTTFEDFDYHDYEDFIDFVNKYDFHYLENGEKELSYIRESLLNNAAAQSALQQLQSIIDTKKNDDLQKNRQEIINAIKEELVSRFFFEEGKTRLMLLEDNEVSKSVEILLNPQKYNAILN